MAYAISHCDSSTLLLSPPLFSILSTSIPVAKFSNINFYGILKCQMTQENNYFILQVLHFSHLALLS